MLWARTLVVMTAALTALGVAYVSGGATPDLGHAAGTSVTSDRVSVFKPSGLPTVCTTETLTPSQDTYVNQQASTTTYAGSATLNINVRNGRRARALIQFALPNAGGCTLQAATLRLQNGAATPGRTISVYRAAAPWSDAVVTFGTVPGETGTAVNITAAPGSMEWTVTAHVQAMYAGANDGFLVRDSTEGGTTEFTQAFSSMEAANKPELILEWV